MTRAAFEARYKPDGWVEVTAQPEDEQPPADAGQREKDGGADKRPRRGGPHR